MNELEKDIHYCEHCDEFTLHECRYSRHERDSTQDRFECLTCHWIYTGWTGKYEPPFEERDNV